MRAAAPFKDYGKATISHSRSRPRRRWTRLNWRQKSWPWPGPL